MVRLNPFLLPSADTTAGIWDVLTSQQVIDFVRRHIALRLELSNICELLMDRCLAPDSDWGGVGCDNMTVMIVALKTSSRTKIEWYNAIGDSIEQVDNGTGGGYKTPKEGVDPFAQGPRGGMDPAETAQILNQGLGRYGSGAVGGGDDEEDTEEEEEAKAMKKTSLSPPSTL